MDKSLKAVFSDLPYMEMGTGFLIGLAVGYLLKKTFKILLVLLGVAIVVIFVLESQKVVTINEESLAHTVSVGADHFEHFASFLKERLSKLRFAGSASAVAGFLAGLKMG
jgi:uncharacterized membrane protein (Fun14 family)